MTEYIDREAAICIADYATDEHPYDKNPEKAETFSEYNQGWNDACDYIRERLENTENADVVPLLRSFWESYDTSTYIGSDETGEPRFAGRKFFVCHNRKCRYKSVVRTKYCPNCGRRMDGGTEK